MKIVATFLKIGLTGGIGSGKSTVAQRLQQRGFPIIDADAISRSMTQAHGAAMNAIQNTFGADMLTPEGALHRDRMRDLIFANPQAKKQLESIIHPLVAQEIAAQEKQAVERGATCVVYDIPLLVESQKWQDYVDLIWVIDCSPTTQIARVCARNGLTAAAVERIIAAQAPRAARLACADAVICNDGISLDELNAQVDALVAQIAQYRP